MPQHAPIRQQILTITLTAFNQYGTDAMLLAPFRQAPPPSLAELLDMLLFGIARRAP